MARSHPVAVGRVRVGPADAGRRVSVRHRDPADGRLTDVVGVLESWTGGSLVVVRRDGTSAEAQQDAVVAAKVVPPDVGAYAVQALADTGWPATDREPLGPWLLRWDNDVTRRANAVLVSETVEDLPGQLDRVVEWYARRGSRALLQLPEPWPGDADLDRLGWHRISPTHVLTAPATGLAGRTRDGGGPRVELADTIGPGWLSLVDRFPEQQQEILASILMRTPTRTFATAYDADGTIIGIGRASLDRRDGLAWACLTNLNTAPHARRRGVARAVSAALADWAVAQGATSAYLQVEEGNDAARRLYASLGFVLHHRYDYRLAPA